MRNRLMFALSAGILGAVAMFGFVQATPGMGVASTLLAVGRFEDIDAKTLTDIDPDLANTDFWQTRIKTKGSTDVHVLENRIQPGGTFGWHSHPGPSLVVVKTGALTLYLASDPTCTGRVVGAGSGFVDNGGDVHVVRNEGSVETVVYVTSLVPEGFARRIDEPAPGNCAF
jgi:quercetin dioxygenase-like cupin family protein